MGLLMVIMGIMVVMATTGTDMDTCTITGAAASGGH
jgi:hypothetical protein